jgi:hypothetical protein
MGTAKARALFVSLVQKHGGLDGVTPNAETHIWGGEDLRTAAKPRVAVRPTVGRALEAAERARTCVRSMMVVEEWGGMERRGKRTMRRMGKRVVRE